ncbi:MAG: radical SAM family heme chaperone HemW [Desulfuromonadales bacterium]|nr:radical SAM family heme chaperone HemW [Desulfuromonadales bacterium]
MITRLYIHIPFCQRKCRYCAFVSKKGSASEIDAFVDLLMAEMRQACRKSAPLHTLDSIYLGGGTPSLLQPTQVGRILDLADQLFGLSEGAEITLETNPGTVDQSKLAGFRVAGINRLSMGVQSFDDRMLSTLGRIHTTGQATDCITAARRAGFNNIGIDLIHSLPGQTLEMWHQDLRQALELGTEHLSIYGLTIEDNTDFAERYADHDSLVDEDLSADMFETADSVLTSTGYEHYEIANYARPGFRSRHNSGYWKRDGYLGLGPGAHSFLRCSDYGIRFGNTPDLDEYATSISGGELPRRDRIELTREDALAEFMFLGLRMADGVRSSDLEREFGVSLWKQYDKTLDELVGQGLLTADNEGVRLTKRGMLLSNQVFGRFLE